MSISRPEGITGISFENIASSVPDHDDYDDEPASEDESEEEVELEQTR